MMKTKTKMVIMLCILILLVSSITTYYYGRFIAPGQYRFTASTLTSDTLDASISNFRIAFISDIHLHTKEDLDRLARIVEDINEHDFHMVIFGGDLYDGTPFDEAQVISILKSINSTHGKFAIQGEKDLLYNNEITSILNDSGFELLHNEYRKIYYQDTAFALFGLENNGDISALINNDNKDMFQLVVVHEPDYFEEAAKQNIDLQLSGHSLGGYVNLPIYGPVFRRSNAQNFVNGKHQIGQSTLLISNGLGLESAHRFRLFTANEILSISLSGTKEEEEIPVDTSPNIEEEQEEELEP